MLEENKFSYRALLHGKDAEWYFARGLDDITAAGSYEVRLFHDDMETLGITTADCDKEHYVVAHLFVSESAATGKQQALRVVGQTLLLTICATNAVKAFTRTCEITPKGASWGSWVDLGAASTTDIQDGSITAQKLSSDIRPNAESPLRPLFIAAGAEYNDTGVDISKTAPWGETVTHKAGYYYLNGLGDITEEQIARIYRIDNLRVYEKALLANYMSSSVRTNFPADKNVNILDSSKAVNCDNVATNNETIEVVKFSDNNIVAVNGISYGFYKCKKLHSICNEITMTASSNDKMANAFFDCQSLKYLKIRKLKISFDLGSSPLLYKECALYTIRNATPNSAIAITLHPDAYARLADDADIVAALEAQPLVSLVSA